MTDISRASEQKIRRDAARERGACLVCCLRKATHGTRCAPCRQLRAQESAGVRQVSSTRAERKAARVAAKICLTCPAPVQRYTRCMERRKAEAARALRNRQRQQNEQRLGEGVAA